MESGSNGSTISSKSPLADEPETLARARAPFIADRKGGEGPSRSVPDESSERSLTSTVADQAAMRDAFDGASSGRAGVPAVVSAG